MNIYLAQQFLDHSARENPLKLAIWTPDASFTYGELAQFSTKMANFLIRQGSSPGDRVCIALPKSIYSIGSMFAVLKAGAIYVPLDHQSPAERIRDIMDDCLPAAVICNWRTLEVIRKIRRHDNHQYKIIVMEQEPETEKLDSQELYFLDDLTSESEILNPYTAIDQDVAYILYTSGTTGKPKGVMISHLNICSYIQWAVSYFNIKAEDRILNTSPLHFDMSVFDIFGSIAAGSQLYLLPRKMLIFPKKIIEIIENNQITLWKAISFLLVYFVKAKTLKPSIMPQLTTIIFSGEALPTKYLIEWMKTFPQKSFYNAYGPTEATGISTCYQIRKVPTSPSVVIPIGKACSNTDVFAVDEEGNIVDPGECGELLIRGSGLSLGYWNNHQKTEEVFRQMDIRGAVQCRVYHTGDIVKRMSGEEGYTFIGRRDHQIKYAGYRIESGDIEAALYDAGPISGAAVVAINHDESKSPEIVAFIEAEKGIDKVEIMGYLRKRLPAYMIPHKLEVLSKLPRTDNGKISRPILKCKYLRGAE
jgi:amino acid adenylation domain-containing protein